MKGDRIYPTDTLLKYSPSFPLESFDESIQIDLAEAQTAYFLFVILKHIATKKKPCFSFKLFAALSMHTSAKPKIEPGTIETETVLFNLNTQNWCVGNISNKILEEEHSKAEDYLKNC